MAPDRIPETFLQTTEPEPRITTLEVVANVVVFLFLLVTGLYLLLQSLGWA